MNRSLKKKISGKKLKLNNNVDYSKLVKDTEDSFPTPRNSQQQYCLKLQTCKEYSKENEEENNDEEEEEEEEEEKENRNIKMNENLMNKKHTYYSLSEEFMNQLNTKESKIQNSNKKKKHFFESKNSPKGYLLNREREFSFNDRMIKYDDRKKKHEIEKEHRNLKSSKDISKDVAKYLSFSSAKKEKKKKKFQIQKQLKQKRRRGNIQESFYEITDSTDADHSTHYSKKYEKQKGEESTLMDISEWNNKYKETIYQFDEHIYPLIYRTEVDKDNKNLASNNNNNNYNTNLNNILQVEPSEINEMKRSRQLDEIKGGNVIDSKEKKNQKYSEWKYMLTDSIQMKTEYQICVDSDESKYNQISYVDNNFFTNNMNKAKEQNNHYPIEQDTYVLQNININDVFNQQMESFEKEKEQESKKFKMNKIYDMFSKDKKERRKESYLYNSSNMTHGVISEHIIEEYNENSNSNQVHIRIGGCGNRQENASFEEEHRFFFGKKKKREKEGTKTNKHVILYESSKKKGGKNKRKTSDLVGILNHQHGNEIEEGDEEEERNHMQESDHIMKNLKFKGIKHSKDIILHTKEEKKRKIGKKKNKKISMSLLKNIQGNEDFFQWKKKYQLIKKLALDERKKKRVHSVVFAVFFFLNIFINYDSGILPVSLNKITHDFDLSVTFQGLIGAVPYVGLTLASFFLGTILQKYEQKKVILKSMALNITNIVLCFFCTNKYFFILLRFIYGVTHSVLIIYFPVWADEYAPSINLTLWLGLIHISTIIGITVGYLCTGLLIYFEFIWMYSLLIQAFFLFFFSTILCVIPKDFVNIKNIMKSSQVHVKPSSTYAKFDRTEEDMDFTNMSTSTTIPEECNSNTIIIYISKNNDPMETIEKCDNFNSSSESKSNGTVIEPMSMESSNINEQKKRLSALERMKNKTQRTYFVTSIKAIFNCPLFLWLVCSLCNLFFVVIGISFWSTKFFTNYLKIGALEAMFYFIGTSLTAPIIGILLGSKIVDTFIGGYKEYKNRMKTLYFCIFNSFLTFIIALIICIFENYKVTLIFTWIILLFGAMLLPPITGIILSAVKAEHRSFASAFSLFFYNIFGYALGTFFPGFIVDFFNVSEVVSIKVVYLWSFFGLVNLCIATFVAKRNTTVS